jgi:hypothetical protein
LLTYREREEIAKTVFREQFLAHPVGITAAVLKNAVKYVFAPIESTVSRFATFYASETWYTRAVRPVVAVVCLPLFVLSVLPPIRRQREQQMYYALMLVLLIYVVGFSAIGIGSGERIRFPLLAFMLPVLVWNVETLLNHALVPKLRRHPVRRTTDGGKPA